MTDDVSEIKSRVDIVDLVGDYLPLRRSGLRHWGLCPFHSEKTPSFSVTQDSGTFYCFGCQKGGDIFTFIMEMEGMSFREALENLASRAGVRLSGRSGGASRVRTPGRDLRAVLEAACEFFRSNLRGPGGAAARAYLLRRNIGPDAMMRFELGWAPESWDSAEKHLGSLGYHLEDMISSGVVARGERGTYDRFRGRIIFPVRDKMAKITGFGGRLIDGEGAKYLNSPEGELFNKKRLLYLMHEAKRSVKERGRVILMEGYMDVLRAHLSGFTEAVASLGTSLTEEQARLIKSFSDLCYVAYDADGAGQEASVRGMYILHRQGVEVRVMSMPEGMDPDDLLSGNGGAEKFAGLVDSALPLPLYHVHVRRDDLNTPGREMKAREEIFSGLASLPWLDVRKYIPRIAAWFSLQQHEVEREIRRHGKNEKSANYEEGIDWPSGVYIESANPQRERELDLECAFCSLVWHDEAIRSGLSPADGTELIPLFSDEATAGIIAALVSGESPGELEERWRSVGDRDCPGRIARGDAVLAGGEMGSQHVEKIVESLRMNMTRRRYEQMKPLVLSERATREEIVEYHKWARRLKGGGRS
ncbi:MAG: DNA primase [Synergistaceae bacterium]|jgi:DNA primase|nr:DNA primase [Synergistaceae bacterium]